MMQSSPIAKQQIQGLLKEEATDATARKQIYEMIHFHTHPASRLAENLKKVLRGRQEEEILKHISKNSSVNEDLWCERLKLMKTADRGLYRRGKGCATYIIDQVSEAIDVAPCQIYARDLSSVYDFVNERMGWLIDRPHRLINKERVHIVAKRLEMEELVGKGEYITASWLEEVTKSTSLPNYYFFMSDEEWKEYEEFVESAKFVVNEIISFYLHTDFLENLRKYVAVYYPRLLHKMEGNSPDGYIDKLYDKFRQQVLDGNTCFINYKLSFRSYLQQVLRNILRDCCRGLKRRKNIPNEIPLSQIENEDSIWEFQTNSHEESLEPKILREILIMATEGIEFTEDREILRNALINVPFFDGCRADLDVKGARKALLLWAPKIIQSLGDDITKLPNTFEELLYHYANSQYAKTWRTILVCSKAARERGRDYQWLAKKLGVSEHSLAKWVRCEAFPRQTRIVSITKNISSVKELLEIPNDSA